MAEAGTGWCEAREGSKNKVLPTDYALASASDHEAWVEGGDAPAVRQLRPAPWPTPRVLSTLDALVSADAAGRRVASRGRGGPLADRRRPSGPRRPRRVLVIDGNPKVRAVLTRLLTGFGYDTELAPDGVTRVAMVDRTGFPVVLVNLELPGVGSWAVIEALRRGGRVGALIATSAAGMGAAQRRARQAGIPVLHKPFQMRAVWETLARAMRAPGGSGPPGEPWRRAEGAVVPRRPRALVPRGLLRCRSPWPPSGCPSG